MKKHFFIFLMLTISFSVNSQSLSTKSNSQKHRTIETTIDQDNNLSKKNVLETFPPTKLYVNNLGFATWDAPDIIVELPLWLQYDDGINIQTVGVIGGGTFDAAIKWDPFQLIGFDGTFITKIKFFAGNYPNAVFTIRVYQGDDGDIIYEQPLSTVNYGNWNTIDLDSPVEIDINQSIWVGYNVTHYSGEYPAGAGALVENPNSDLIKIGSGSWGHMQTNLPNSWNLAAFVEGDNGKQVQLPDATYHNDIPLGNTYSNVLARSSTNTKVIDPDYSTNELIGFKVYLNGEFISSTTNYDWQFNNLFTGENYLAAVSAVYTDGESDVIEMEFSYLGGPKNFTITPEGMGSWGIPSLKKASIYLDEDFNGGLPNDWEVIVGGNTEDTWEVVENYQENSFDGTSFIIVSSDNAGANSLMDEFLLSPVIDVSESTQLLLKWDQNFRGLSNKEDFVSIKVYDGLNWIEVFNQTENDPAWPEYAKNVLDLSAYANSEFQLKFHYYADGWCWWIFLDNIFLYNGETISYNLYLDDALVGTTNNTSWQYLELTEGQTYKGGVSAVYELGESDASEYEFSYQGNEYYLEVTPPIKEVSYLGGTTYFTVTSNNTWHVSSSDSWINIVSPIGSGDGYFEVQYDENITEARIGTIIVQSNDEQTDTVTILQDNFDDFLPPRNLHITEYGLAVWDSPDGDLTDLVGYNVYLDGELYTSTLEQNKKFLTLIPNQTYTAGIQAVYIAQNLSSIIESEFIYTSDIDIFVIPQIQTTATEVGSVIYTVFSNTDWAVDSEDSWVTISPPSGTDDGEIRVFFLENTADERIAQIVISAEGLDDVTVSLIQQGTNSLITQVSILPNVQDVNTSEPFYNSLEIIEVENLANFEFEILFNPSFLHVASSDVGDFITSTGRDINVILNNINNDFGFIEVEVSTIGDGIPGADGNGVLLNIDWDVIGQGNAQTTTGLLLRNVSCFEPNGSQIESTSNDATVIIAPNSIYCENGADQINIIPNPSNGNFLLQIQGVRTDMKLLIFNPGGKLISDLIIENNGNPEFTQDIDLSQMSKGVYILKLVKDLEVITLKAIVL